jgi:hypothetical protein
VQISGAQGYPAPETLKVSVGIDGGLVGVGEISYAGPGCLAHARLAADIIGQRWVEVYGYDPSDIAESLIGLTSSTPWRSIRDGRMVKPPEARLRLAVQSLDRQAPLDLIHEVEALYTNGPAGSGGVEVHVRDTVAVLSTLIPRGVVQPRVQLLEVAPRSYQ